MRATEASDLTTEALAKDHLLTSGVVDILKQANVVIWTIRCYHGKLRIAIDIDNAPNADKVIIEEELQQVLQPLLSKTNTPLTVAFTPIAGNCCYGVCQGCLNGDPDARVTWIPA